MIGLLDALQDRQWIRAIVNESPKSSSLSHNADIPFGAQYAQNPAPSQRLRFNGASIDRLIRDGQLLIFVGS